jgi:hypothetical protein
MSPPGSASVLSGNIKPNAITKLSAFGLEGFMDFEVGGYGSDDEARANPIAVAQAKATTKYGKTFDKANTGPGRRYAPRCAGRQGRGRAGSGSGDRVRQRQVVHAMQVEDWGHVPVHPGISRA